MCFSLKGCGHLPVGRHSQSGHFLFCSYLLQKDMSLDNRNQGQNTRGTIVLLHLPWYLVSHSLLHYFNDFIFQRSLYLHTICICSILRPYVLELLKTLRPRRGFNGRRRVVLSAAPAEGGVQGVWELGLPPFWDSGPLLPNSDTYSELCLGFWEQSLLLITPSMSLEFRSSLPLFF